MGGGGGMELLLAYKIVRPGENAFSFRCKFLALLKTANEGPKSLYLLGVL